MWEMEEYVYELELGIVEIVQEVGWSLAKY